MKRLVAFALAGLAGCGGGSGPRTPAIVEHGDGVRWVLPAGWHAAAGSLTPHLVNPRELLTAGTGRLSRTPARCAQFPSGALAAMRAGDVLVTVQERFGSARSFPPRPAHFALGPAPGVEADACAGPHPAFVGHWFQFAEGHRAFHVLIAVGRSASRARVNQALELLDSLRIAPRRPLRVNSDDAIPALIDGMHLVHPSQWRMYRPALTEAISRSNQIALGTFRLHQRTPDPNCTPRTALRARPSNGGFVFLYRRGAVGLPPRPARLRLSGPRAYECFGTSWRVDFRAAGRGYTAHVYGGPRRRREALAILDSLR